MAVLDRHRDAWIRREVDDGRSSHLVVRDGRERWRRTRDVHDGRGHAACLHEERTDGTRDGTCEVTKNVLRANRFSDLSFQRPVDETIERQREFKGIRWGRCVEPRVSWVNNRQIPCKDHRIVRKNKRSTFTEKLATEGGSCRVADEGRRHGVWRGRRSDREVVVTVFFAVVVIAANPGREVVDVSDGEVRWQGRRSEGEVDEDSLVKREAIGTNSTGVRTNGGTVSRDQEGRDRRTHFSDTKRFRRKRRKRKPGVKRQ